MTEPVTLTVTELVEWRITVDPADPHWDFLTPDCFSDPGKLAQALDRIADETEGPVECALRRTNPIDAWREVRP